MQRIGATRARNAWRWQALRISTLLAVSLCKAQVTYYVDGACGDDAWSGLSANCAPPDGPKASIQAAIDAAADGDTVLVAPGTYVGDYQLNRVITLQSIGGAEVTTLTPGAWRTTLNCNVPMTDSPTISGFRFLDGGGNCCTSRGGAINVQSGSPIVTDCEFYGNGVGREGGAIYAPDGSVLTLLRCLFVGNSVFNTSAGSFARGGAVRAGQFIIDSCRFENNRAIWFCLFCEPGGGSSGGALYGTGVVTNSTFIGNGSGSSAAMSLGHGSTIVNCTIVSNTGYEHGAIFSAGEVSIFNSIVRGNSSPEQIYAYSGADVRHSNVQGGYSGEGNIDADPRFVVNPDPAPNVGGCYFCFIEVGDVRLYAGSPCIDAGDTSALPADELDVDGDGDTTEPLPFDLAGNPRVVRGWPGPGNAVVVDMGAYERQMRRPVLFFHAAD